MGACHRRPLSLLSVRRGWAIGSPVIVDETIGMWLGFSLPGCWLKFDFGGRVWYSEKAEDSVLRVVSAFG